MTGSRGGRGPGRSRAGVWVVRAGLRDCDPPTAESCPPAVGPPSRSPHAGPGENPENELFRLTAPDDTTLPRPVTVSLDAPFSAAERTTFSGESRNLKNVDTEQCVSP